MADGRLLAAARWYGVLEIWSLADGKRVENIRVDGHESFNSVAFSPDGRTLAAGRGDGAVELRPTADPKASTALGDHGADVLTVTFSPDGERLVSTDRTGGVRLWSVPDRALQQTLRAHTGGCSAAAVSPDGGLLATGGEDKVLALWSLPSGRLLEPIAGHTAAVAALAFAPDGARLAVSRGDGSVDLWTLPAVGVARRLSGPSLGYSLAFSPDGRLLAAGDWHDKVFLRAMPDGRLVETLDGQHESGGAVAYAPRGDLIASGACAAHDGTGHCTRGVVTFWSAPDGAAHGAITGHSKAIASLAFAPDGRLLATGGEDAEINLWSLPERTRLRTLRGHTGPVNSVAFSPDGRLLASAGHEDLRVRLWSVPDGALLRTVDGRFWGESVRFSPDGTVFASPRTDRQVALFSAPDGALVRTLAGRADADRLLDFSPAGRLLAASAENHAIKIWSYADGRLLATLVAFTDGEWLAFTPEGYYDATIDGAARVSWLFPGTKVAAFEQYEAVLKRPDLVAASLAGQPPTAPPALTPPPGLSLSGSFGLFETHERSFEAKLTLPDPGRIERVRVFVNGKLRADERVKPKQARLTVRVPVAAGMNRLTAVAFDARGYSSRPQSLDVRSDRAPTKKPTLHVLAVGVSTYAALGPRYALDYAHKDAADLSAALAAQKGKLYDDVRVTVLSNEDAKRARIDAALASMANIPADDLAVIFLAGHGVRDPSDDRFYFLTADSDLAALARTGLGWEALQARLAALQCRTVMFLDACHSGAVSPETVVPNDALVERLVSEGRAGVVIVSAAKGWQSSVESPDVGSGQGVFTWALLEALGAVPRHEKLGYKTRDLVVDTDGNGTIELSELSRYVGLRVDDMTAGFQVPRLARAEIFGDFAIARLP